MNALLWFLTIVIGIYLFFYLLGPVIFRGLLKYLNRKAQQHMEAQSRFYEQNVENSDAFSENIYIDDDTRIRVPKGYEHQKKKRKPDPAEIEEVEFEEVDGE